MWNLERNDTDELTKQKGTHRLKKPIYGCWGEGIVREFGKVKYTLLYSKWITNKDLFLEHMDLFSMLYASLHRKGFEGEWIPVCV